ncbi:fatty acid desaturase-domain-containing protein [Cytidiella melzeri]|nr:fatty acid desaturase-domain-containing protein [Cytidiella melzeri]
MQEIRNIIPSHCFDRKTAVSLQYLVRDLAMAAVLCAAATRIEGCFDVLAEQGAQAPHAQLLALEVGRWFAWLLYWWFQGLTFTGLWVIGHECGHGAFSPNRTLGHTIGFIVHSFLWTPYFSWAISHHRHHANHNSMERDEVYVPKTRSDLGIPSREQHKIEWHEYFEDTPVYTLFTLLRQQLLAFPAYLLFNVSGQKSYPWPTCHFDPNAVLFNESQRYLVILSNIGLLVAGCCVKLACDAWGGVTVLKFYGVPWLMVTHWFIMITYLHHTDPAVPHYRDKTWNYQRGASSTVDRDFLGWQGRFFLHGVGHFHVIHHFFPQMPHYHAEEATKYLKAFLGEHYHYSDQPVFQALWYNYNACQFVEDDGEVIFYRNKKGEVAVPGVQCS